MFRLSQESRLSAIISPLLFLVTGAERGRGGVGRCFLAQHTVGLSSLFFVADYCAMTNCCPEGCFPVN